MYCRHIWRDYRLAFGDEITTQGSISIPDEFYKVTLTHEPPEKVSNKYIFLVENS